MRLALRSGFCDAPCCRFAICCRKSHASNLRLEIDDIKAGRDELRQTIALARPWNRRNQVSRRRLNGIHQTPSSSLSEQGCTSRPNLTSQCPPQPRLFYSRFLGIELTYRDNRMSSRAAALWCRVACC
ncbi:hypothetical protein N5P37_009014 [Trichoderma harzianum]|nr:hypothetical protein N5P37_009014 [Trichoderma harzianum]